MKDFRKAPEKDKYCTAKTIKANVCTKATQPQKKKNLYWDIRHDKLTPNFSMHKLIMVDS